MVHSSTTRPSPDQGLPLRIAVVELLAAVLVVGLAGGCGASSRPRAFAGQPVEYMDAVPRDIESHPRCSYKSGFAYLFEERWYYKGPIGWLVFVDEPEALH